MRAFSVVIMAGGTGGHVFPALAVAKQLLAEGCRVTWLGTRKGIEAKLVPEAGIDIDYLDVTGVRGKSAKTLIMAPFKIVNACIQAWKILKRRAPQLVLGFGGFASGPGGLVARLRGIPLIIHEQNAVAGTTNRILALLANKVLLGFSGALKKGVFVGNPVRAEVFSDVADQPVKTQEHDALNILILGGSLGARAINELVPAALERVKAQVPLNVLHQSGASQLQATQSRYESISVQQDLVRIEPFITDMASAYHWADIVICRAGALTVAEITAAGKAAIFIPYPYAIDDHQTENARWLVNKNAASMFQESELTADLLAEKILDMALNPDKRREMAANARALAQSESVKDIVALCRETLL